MSSLSLKTRPPAHHAWLARVIAWLLVGVLALLALAGCLSDAQPSGSKRANFGDAKNHIHSMLALPGHPDTLLVGTHYGLFRTTDGGKTWKKVLGDKGQLAEGLMTQYLTVSPVNPNRVYVEAITYYDLPKSTGVPGIYTSTDGGATWSLVAALSSLPSPSLYYLVAGPGNEGQVYTYFQQLQEKGLFESLDGGVHWQPLGTLPDTLSLGLVVDPAHPGHLFTYTASGLFASEDNGSHWQPAPGIKNGISKATLSGSMLYASGDDGTFVSQDGGAHFTLAAPNHTFQFLASSPQNPTTALGLSGSTLSITTDGGQSWKPLNPPTARLITPYLVVAPDNPQIAYLGNSYPVAVYASSNSGQTWSQIAP